MTLFQTHQQSRASIVDGKLILSLPTAISPVVWQMDLNSAKASALEIEIQDTNFALILKNTNEKTTVIASFTDKKAAINSLMVTAKALENASGKIANPTSTTTTSAKSSLFKKILMGLGVIALLLITLNIISALSGLSTKTSQQNSLSEEPTSGVPMSADDFLKGR